MQRSIFPVILLALLAAPLGAQQNQPLKVGVMPVAPFVLEEEDGSLRGISIDLWEQIAADMELEFEYERYEYDVQGLLDAVEAGEVDAAVAAFTITAEREERIDFTHSYFSTGLGIAARRAGGQDILTTLGSFFAQFAGPLLGLLGVLLAVGGLMWLLERRKNADQFSPKTIVGLADGLWWSAVTMTTVGYGDKAPSTFGGRIVGLIWMFASLFLISFFTAALASSFTAVQLTATIGGLEDLDRARVGVVDGANAQQHLQGLQIRAFGYPNLQEAVEALNSGELDAVVHDQPILQYLIQENRWTDLVVLPEALDQQKYGIALQEGSELREQIDRALLRTLRSQEWRDIRLEYLGQATP